jgi:hypothetical protein
MIISRGINRNSALLAMALKAAGETSTNHGSLFYKAAMTCCFWYITTFNVPMSPDTGVHFIQAH